MAEQWVDVATVAEVPHGFGLRVSLDELDLALWNVDGQFYATNDTCTHEEASLSEGDLWDGVVECPLHGAQFDVRTGRVMSLPAVIPIATYPVRVEGETIAVQLPA